jgi:hypothetical protein
MLWRIVRKSRRRLHLSGHLFTTSSVYTVGRARVGGGATLIQVGAHTPPPPPPHRKSGVPDLRDDERVSGRPEIRGQESKSGLTGSRTALLLRSISPGRREVESRASRTRTSFSRIMREKWT